MQHIKQIAACALLAILTATLASATSIYPYYDQPSPFSGFRNVPPPSEGGLTLTDDKKGTWADGTLTWTVAEEGGALRYTYIFNNFDKPALSHFSLDLSDDCTVDPGCVTQAQVKNGDAPWAPITGSVGKLEFGNVDGITGGVKFDTGNFPGGFGSTVAFTFLSNRVPVYGDFFMKAGSDTRVTNAGFGNKSLGVESMYIARPDSVYFESPSGVPEPGSMLLFAAGSILILMGRLAKSRRQN